MQIGDFRSIDSDVKTTQSPNESSILDSVQNKNNTAENCNEDEDEENAKDHDVEINKLSHYKMLKYFKVIRRWLDFVENALRIANMRDIL